jgi:hypothetical protein
MIHTLTLSRTIAALVATAALAAPAAYAGPLHEPALIATPPPSDDSGDGSPLTTVGLGLAGACLLIGGSAGIATRTRRRTRRARVAA